MKNNPKTKFSALLAVLMMLTCIPWTTPVTASAAETIHRYDMMNTDWITVGAEYVTVNTDGTWMITGPIAISPNLTLDYTVYSRLLQQFEVINGTAGMALLDRDPNGVYWEHWIDLNGEFNSGDRYSDGKWSYNCYLKGVYDWNIDYNQMWQNQNNLFTVNTLYIEPSSDATIILETLEIVDDTIPDVPTLVATTTTTTATHPTTVGPVIPNPVAAKSLLPLTADQFETVDDGWPDAIGTMEIEAQDGGYRFSTDIGWPYAAYNMGENGLKASRTTDVYLNYDIEVKAGYSVTYIFFGGKDPHGKVSNLWYMALNDYVDPSAREYGLVTGRYVGSINIRDLYCDKEVMDEEGNLVLSGCKIYAKGQAGEADVIIRELSVGGQRYGDSPRHPTTTTQPADEPPIIIVGGTTMVIPGSGYTTAPSIATTTTTTTTRPNYTPNWTTTVSLMPATASEFKLQEAGEGQITVTPQGSGYRFDATQGWPYAMYDRGQDGIVCNQNDDLYLNYDFEVLSGRTCVNVYFGGVDPEGDTLRGGFVTINGIIDPSYVDENGMAVVDLPVGTYTGSVKISDLTIAANLVDEDGDVMFSGCKIFAVNENGSVVVRELSIGEAAYDVVVPSRPNDVIGDMSGDGELNTMDALLLFAVINGAKTATAEQQALADFNGDGVLNMMDALLLFKRVSGQ